MHHPLAPDAMYPAGVPGVAAHSRGLATGVRLRTVEAGPPTGSPVVLLHGWGASAYMFRHALARFPVLGLRTIAVDLRGFGLSDRPVELDEYSLTAYLSDIDALLDALGIARAAFIGQSMGGGLSLRYALTRPARVASLCLINPTGLVSLRGVELIGAVPGAIVDALGIRVRRSVVANILRRVAYGDASLVTDQIIDEYWSPTQLPGFVHAARASLGGFDWSRVTDSEAAALRVPTLVVLGDRDRLIRNDHASALRLRGARVQTVPGGHCAHEENPDVVYPIIEQALSLA